MRVVAHRYYMNTFAHYLLNRENFDPNTLFTAEAERLLSTLKQPANRQDAEKIRTFDWVGFIVAALREAGFKGQEINAKAHEIIVGLGTLFHDYDEGEDGPLLDHFKGSVAKAVKKLVAKAYRRRSSTLKNTFPLAFISLSEKDQRAIEEFRKVVHKRLGTLGVAVFDAQIGGEKITSLVGAVDLGNPTANLLKQTVRRLRQFAVEYGQAVGDPEFLRRAKEATAAWRAEG